MPFDQYHALVLELIALKRDGFVAPEHIPEPAAAPTLPAAVTKAIASIAVGNPMLERTLIDSAWNLTHQGYDEKEVAQMILDGEPVEL